MSFTCLISIVLPPVPVGVSFTIGYKFSKIVLTASF